MNSLSLSLSRARSAFTLVELMIVIAIIGILAAALFPAMSSYLARARDTQRISDLKKIRQALIGYYTDIGYYPITNGLWATDTPTAGYDPVGAHWIALQNKLNAYIQLPKDPVSQGPQGPWFDNNYHYAYRGESGYTDYDLVAGLETRDHALSCKKQHWKYHIGDNPTDSGACWCGMSMPSCVGGGSILPWSANIVADH